METTARKTREIPKTSDRVSRNLGKYRFNGRLRGNHLRVVRADIQLKMQEELLKGREAPKSDVEWDDFINYHDSSPGYDYIRLNNGPVSSLKVTRQQEAKVLAEAEIKGINNKSSPRVWDDMIRMTFPIIGSRETEGGEYRDMDLAYTYAKSQGWEFDEFTKFNPVTDTSAFWDMYRHGVAPYKLETDWVLYPPVKVLIRDSDALSLLGSGMCDVLRINNFSFRQVMQMHGFEIEDRGNEYIVRVCNSEILVDAKTDRVRNWLKVLEVVDQWSRLNECKIEVIDVQSDLKHIATYFTTDRNLEPWSSEFDGYQSVLDDHPVIGDLFTKVKCELALKGYKKLTEGENLHMSIAILLQKMSLPGDRLKINQLLSELKDFKTREEIDEYLILECPRKKPDNISVEEREKDNQKVADEIKNASFKLQPWVDPEIDPMSPKIDEIDLADQFEKVIVGDTIRSEDGPFNLVFGLEVAPVEDEFVSDLLAVNGETYSDGSGFRGLMELCRRYGFTYWDIDDSSEIIKYVDRVNDEIDYTTSDPFFGKMCSFGSNDVAEVESIIARKEKERERFECILWYVPIAAYSKESYVVTMIQNYKNVRFRLEKDGKVAMALWSPANRYIAYERFKYRKVKLNSPNHMGALRLLNGNMYLGFVAKAVRKWYDKSFWNLKPTRIDDMLRTHELEDCDGRCHFNATQYKSCIECNRKNRRNHDAGPEDVAYAREIDLECEKLKMSRVYTSMHLRFPGIVKDEKLSRRLRAGVLHDEYGYRMSGIWKAASDKSSRSVTMRDRELYDEWGEYCLRNGYGGN